LKSAHRKLFPIPIQRQQHLKTPPSWRHKAAEGKICRQGCRRSDREAALTERRHPGGIRRQEKKLPAGLPAVRLDKPG